MHLPVVPLACVLLTCQVSTRLRDRFPVETRIDRPQHRDRCRHSRARHDNVEPHFHLNPASSASAV
jgi:hypothetical protein